MKLKGIIFEDFVNYKKPCMVLEFPYCSWKCDKESGMQVCQNSTLASYPDIDVDIGGLVHKYISNPITEAIVCAGLEPMDSFNDLVKFINNFRECTNDDIVIYTGYCENEIRDKIHALQMFHNIIIKYGRYVPNQNKIYDPILGVELASDNQYAIQIS